MRPSSITVLFATAVISTSFFCASMHAHAAACCGGGSASPSTITSDDLAQVSASFSLSEIVVDNVDSSGFWRRSDVHQTIKTYKLQGARLLSDRWQAGLVFPVMSRERLGEQHSGVGDIAGTLGYEFLPDWNYNPIRPKGIGFLQITLPGGISRYESSIGGLDSTGNGFLAFSLGSVFTKTWNAIDAVLLIEAHRSFSKNVQTSIGQVELDPDFGGDISIGAGYNLGDLRMGGMITWSVEDAVKIVSANASSDGSVERYATANLSLSYLFSEQWAGTLTYTDQTWFGDPINTSLGRGGAIQVQRKWTR